MPMQISISNAIGGGGGAQGAGGSSFTNTKSILLDGVDDYVEAKSTTLGLDTAISVSMWVKTTQSTSNFKQLVGEYDWSNSNKRNWILYLSNSQNKLAFLLYNSLGQTVINKSVDATDANIDDGNWHHVLVTWDGTTNTNSFNMFFDGVNVKQATPTKTGIRTSDTPLLIADGTNGNVEFEGNIDEVAVWNSDQSSNVTDIYNSGVPTSLATYNPLLWYRCGDGDTAPTLTDHGSGGNNGTMTNFSTFSTDVPVELFSRKSIELDGVDDYVNVADNSNLSFGDGSNDSPFSISAWVNIDNKNRFRIVSKYDSNLEYLLTTSGSGILVFNLYDNSNGSRISRRISSVMATNTWIHLITTYDGSSSSSGIKIYMNGSRADDTTSDSGSYTAMENTTAPFEIGKTLSVVANGHIDEVSVFNSELSASDVTTIYNGGVPNDISALNPLSWWRCGDGDTAPTLTDNGSGGNNGTMTNFSTFSTDVPT